MALCLSITFVGPSHSGPLNQIDTMKTQRFILTYTGGGALPPGDVAQLQAQVAVLDLSRHGLLVEDVPGHLTQLLQTMPQWRAEPERMYKAL
jgi:hypothetical protein